MDWTSVFEEDGDETFLIHQHLTALQQHKQPRMARLVSILYHHQENGEDEDTTHQGQAHEDQDVDSIGRHRLFQITSSYSSLLDAVPLYRRNTINSMDTGGGISKNGASTSSSNNNKPAYTLRALYYLSINYILGVGCLGIPYAFARAGFILCITILVVVSLSSFCTVMWVAEAGERYRTHWKQQQQQQLQVSQQRQQQKEQDKLLQRQLSSEGTSLLPRNQSETSASSVNDCLVDLDEQEQHHQQHWDRYEVVDLVGFYLGTTHKVIYQISLMALMYIGLLAYSQVFCSAISEIFWGPTAQQQPAMPGGIPQWVFAAMVIPLSCVELDEQISVQSLMAAVRFVAIFIMVFGSILSLILDDSNVLEPHDGTVRSGGPPYWAPAKEETCQMSYSYCFRGFGVAFSTSLFSQLFQHSIPGLLRPLRASPTRIKKVPKTLGASLLTTLSFYLLLGSSAASFFGANTRSSVNLNFANFTMGFDKENSSIVIFTAIRFAANIVVIFPALDTISVFPLIANTLGNNLCSAAIGPKTTKWVAQSLHTQKVAIRRVQAIMCRHGSNQRMAGNSSYDQLSSDERKLLFEQSSRVTTIFWRLVAALPPLLGSLIAADLSFSLLLAGAAGVYVAFFAPSLLQLRSISHSSSSASAKTIFQGWYSSSCLCYPVLAFAMFSLAAVLIQIKAAWLEILHN